jgi:rhamnogalacturonan hydrolase
MTYRTGYSAPTMPGQLSTLALSVEIPIPTIPTTFFPGATPASKLLSASAKAKRDFQA